MKPPRSRAGRRAIVAALISIGIAGVVAWERRDGRPITEAQRFLAAGGHRRVISVRDADRRVPIRIGDCPADGSGDCMSVRLVDVYEGVPPTAKFQVFGAAGNAVIEQFNRLGKPGVTLYPTLMNGCEVSVTSGTSITRLLVVDETDPIWIGVELTVSESDRPGITVSSSCPEGTRLEDARRSGP